MNVGPANQQAVLERFAAVCERDERVTAAFVGGSLASGKADEWSDLDIYVITTDAAFQDFAAHFDSFVSHLGEPVFLEKFGFPHGRFFIFADGTEGEIHFGSESHFLDIHKGPYRVLLDKKGILAGVTFLGFQNDPDEQVENLRRQVYGFWHDLSHFMTALARGQLWWAHGQLEALRSSCVSLARFRSDFTDPEAGDEPYFKVEQAVPVGDLAPLALTIHPIETGALLRSALTLVDYYRDAALPLTQAHGVSYPADLERVMLERMERLQQSMR